MRSYRKEYRPEIILRDLRFIHEKKIPVSLWQSQQDNKYRLMVNFEKVHAHQKGLDFIPMKDQFDFDSKAAVYFFCPWRNYIFKTTAAFTSAFKITLRLPDMAIMNEARQCMRKVFYHTNHTLSFRFLSTSDISDIDYEKKLLDMSTKGAAFRITRPEAQLFEVGDQIEVTNLKDGHRVGKVKNISSYLDIHYQKGDYYRVGIEYL